MDLSEAFPQTIPNLLPHCNFEESDWAYNLETACTHQYVFLPFRLLVLILLNQNCKRNIFRINSIAIINNFWRSRFIWWLTQPQISFTPREPSQISNSCKRILRLGCNTIHTSRTQKIRKWRPSVYYARANSTNFTWSHQQIFKKPVWTQRNLKTNCSSKLNNLVRAETGVGTTSI